MQIPRDLGPLFFAHMLDVGAERANLLSRRLHLCLRPLALGDVLDHADVHGLAIGDHHLAHSQREWERASVLSPSLDLPFRVDDVGFSGQVVTVQVTVVLLVVGRRHEHPDVLAHDLRGEVSEDSLACPVEGLNGARLVDGYDSVGGGVKDQPNPSFLGRPDRLLFPALGDVLDHADVHGLAIGDHHLAHSQREWERASVLSPSLDLPFRVDDVGFSGQVVTVQVTVVLLAVGRRHEHPDVLAHDLRGEVSEDSLACPVEGLNGARLVDGYDSVGGGVKDQPNPSFLGRPDRLLFPALGDVLDHADVHGLAIGDHHLAHSQREWERASVLSPSLDLPFRVDDVGFSGQVVTVQVTVVLLAVGRRHEHPDVLAHDLRGEVSEDSLACPVEGLNGARLVDGYDSVGGGVKDQPNPSFLGRPDRLLFLIKVRHYSASPLLSGAPAAPPRSSPHYTPSCVCRRIRKFCDTIACGSPIRLGSRETVRALALDGVDHLPHGVAELALRIVCHPSSVYRTFGKHQW